MAGRISYYGGIVKDGLVLDLDAGKRESFVSGSSSWNNLLPFGLTTTLYNTPEFSNGVLSFNDVNLEYGETISNHPDYNVWSCDCWVKFNTSLAGKCTAVVCGEYDLSSKLNFSIGTNNFPTNSNIAVGFFNGAWRSTTGFVPQLSTWYNIVGTYDGSTIRQYVNGVASGGTLNYVGSPQSGGKIRIARRWDSALTSTNLLGGSVPIVKLYSRALTESEVLQNYNATKGRYL